MACPNCVSLKLPKTAVNDVSYAATVHPECWVFHTMPHMYQARGSVVQTGSRKIACFFSGPLVIYKAVGPNQFFLMSLDGQIYPHLIEETRLKPGTIWTSKGNVTTLVKLRQALCTGLKIQAKQDSHISSDVWSVAKLT